MISSLARSHVHPVSMYRPSAGAWTVMGLVAAAFLIRMPSFGDPALHFDEQFYLLVGDRMLHGAVPFVDIWDRKPIGLFLLYAAIRMLGGEGVIQYQVVATMFAGGTAAAICAIARRPAGLFGGIVAGLAYLVWIETAEGGGGQSPVFYNLPVALAAWCVLAVRNTTDRPRARRLAFAAMALSGIAIQIKYTALFECLYFGLVLAWIVLRREARLGMAGAELAALALTALAPTIAATLAYVAIGHFAEFWFANFVSIFLRGPSDMVELHDRVHQIILHLLPFAICAGASVFELRNERGETRDWTWFVAGWVVAALAGFFSVGALYYHYMLPLFVPLSIAAAPIYRRWPLGKVLAGLMLWLPLSHFNYPDFASTRYSQGQIAQLAAMVPSDVDRHCLHVFSGPPILYKVTNACLVSPYIFPDHLVAANEAGAVGIDQAAEIRRIMMAHPRAIVTDEDLISSNSPRDRLLRTMRNAAYRRVGGLVIDHYRFDVWVTR